MIDEAVWNLGGWNAISGVNVRTMYEKERGITVYSGRPSTWTGKVALPYPSDYVWASLDSDCTSDISKCNTDNAKNNNYF